jgi:hypothetical protein
MARLLAACVVLFTVLAGAIPASGELYNGGSYSINFGEEWVRIPPDVVQRQLGSLPGADKANIEAAYQLKKDKDWFTYPYVVLYTVNYPGTREPTAADMKTVTKPLESTGTLSLDTKAGKFRAVQEQTAVGLTIKGLINGHFGKRQLVKVEGFALDKDFPTFQPQFAAIDDSFQFNSGEEYTGKSGSKRVGRYGAYGLIAVVVGLVIRFFGKKKLA